MLGVTCILFGVVRRTLATGLTMTCLYIMCVFTRCCLVHIKVLKYGAVVAWAAKGFRIESNIIGYDCMYLCLSIE